MASGHGEPPCIAPQGDAPLSKNKLKKMKRDQEWEAGRELRKKLRKEKVKEKKLRKRAARDEGASQPSLNPEDSNYHDRQTVSEVARPHRPQNVQVPITVVIDCGFDELMQENERKSLGSQVTRCYSDNHKAPYQAHLAISSFGGHLKERFDNLLSGHHRSWKGVCFLDGDFVAAAAQAKEWMQAPEGGTLAGALSRMSTLNPDNSSEEAGTGETVYLTSDSPNTLSTLKPYSIYIIGGLVDKNRYKGICYKKAMEAGVKTAKLPIGDYMQMNSRFVLATNHVSEIIVRWLDCGDWGKAFDLVVPKRKGGVLKDKRSRVEGLAQSDEDGRVGHDKHEGQADASNTAGNDVLDSNIDEKVSSSP
ncbi:MAG: hypothetical protein Q9195_000251 [Heterodermia aff. obscurata]